MVRYVDREPSSNASTVVCFRCGGNHFAKNKQDPSKNCKMPPVCAKTVASYPPASVPASVNASAGEAALQDMWAGFVRAEKDRRAREKKRSSVFPSSQRSSVAAQAGLGEDALAQLALVSAKLAKMQEQLNLLLSKDSLSRVDASVQTDVFAVAVQTVSRQLGVADACVGTACFAAAQTDAVPDGLDVAVQWPGTVSVDVCTDAVQHSDCGVQAACSLSLSLSLSRRTPTLFLLLSRPLLPVLLGLLLLSPLQPVLLWLPLLWLLLLLFVLWILRVPLLLLLAP